MPSTCEVEFAGHRFVLDADLALYWPAESALIVSDLHLEKATFLAQFGSAVAPYDTLDTLLRLEALVAKYRPHTLILLGDSFHDRRAWQRLEPHARERLLSICGSVETCHMVEGNHDVGLLLEEGVQFTDAVTLSGIDFRHEPQDGPHPQVIGHFHPKLRTSLRGHRLSGKCFAMTETLLILPAFGSFTGGLDIKDQAFAQLADGKALRTFIAYRNTIAAIAV